jgi:BlaI family penicillinase repressor
MPPPRLSRLEMAIMEVLWTDGASSVRKIQERFPKRGRPAYNTIQTTIGRLEGKKAVARIEKIGNAQIYGAAVSRDTAQRRLLDDLMALFGGQTQPVMSYLIDTGKLTVQDIENAGKELRGMAVRDNKP